MKLGISSLSHLIGVAMQSQNLDTHKILLQATRSCLEFSESHHLEVCELILDPPTILDPENKTEFINLCKEFSISKQIHATFVDVSLCSFNQAISDTTLAIYKNNAAITKAIGASTLTFHPSCRQFGQKS